MGQDLVGQGWFFRGPLLSGKTVFGPFSLLFRPFPRQREPNASGSFYGASSLPGRPHAGVSPGEFTGSWWGLAPKKNSSEELGLAEKGRALEVSSEDCV